MYLFLVCVHDYLNHEGKAKKGEKKNAKYNFHSTERMDGKKSGCIRAEGERERERELGVICGFWKILTAINTQNTWKLVLLFQYAGAMPTYTTCGFRTVCLGGPRETYRARNSKSLSLGLFYI